MKTNNTSPILQARVPEPMLAAVDTAAEYAGQSRSDILRQALETELRSRGVWPPRPPMGDRRG
jgi:hypothetical protein